MTIAAAVAVIAAVKYIFLQQLLLKSTYLFRVCAFGFLPFDMQRLSVVKVYLELILSSASSKLPNSWKCLRYKCTLPGA